MKIIAFVLLVLLIWLQYKIWLQDGGIPEVVQLQQEIEEVKTEVQQLQERNLSLDAEVKDLKKGLDAIEERARSEMGMIKEGEVYSKDLGANYNLARYNCTQCHAPQANATVIIDNQFNPLFRSEEDAKKTNLSENIGEGVK